MLPGSWCQNEAQDSARSLLAPVLLLTSSELGSSDSVDLFQFRSLRFFEDSLLAVVLKNHKEHGIFMVIFGPIL